MARYGQRPENALKRANGKLTKFFLQYGRHDIWSLNFIFIYNILNQTINNFKVIINCQLILFQIFLSNNFIYF